MAKRLNIFISYKRGEGDDAAREIENYLTRKKNYSVFRDVDKIEGGEDWSQKIVKSIKKSDIFILVLTPLSLSSGEVEKEVREAQRWNRRILPCKHENVNIKELKWDLGKLNIIEYSDKNISALLLSIDDSIDAYISEKRKKSVKKGLSISIPIVTIVLVTYFFIIPYFLNSQIEYSYSYQYQYNMSIGTEGFRNVFANLSSPYGIATDSSGNVYVADKGNNRIQKFSSNGTFITKWGESGSAADKFTSPSGIATDSSGNVYVTDTLNNRIQKFSSNGTFITKWGEKGKDQSEFSFPYGIATDSSGNVYVADTFNNRIQKFSSNGTFITKWGESGSVAGKFSSPYGIAIDSSGNVYVADTKNNRIQKFSSNGTYITKWGEFGKDQSEFYSPSGIATDSSGNVYVADTKNNRIQKFSSNGTFITKWGESGKDQSRILLSLWYSNRFLR